MIFPCWLKRNYNYWAYLFIFPQGSSPNGRVGFRRCGFPRPGRTARSGHLVDLEAQQSSTAQTAGRDAPVRRGELGGGRSWAVVAVGFFKVGAAQMAENWSWSKVFVLFLGGGGASVHLF